MTFLLFTLVAANLCLCLAFAAVFDVFPLMVRAAWAALLLGSAAVALGSLAARKNPILRFLFVLLPPLALLLTKSTTQMLLLLPAVIYPAAVLISARFTVSYLDYRNHFLWSGGVLILLIFTSQLHRPTPLPALFGTMSLVLAVFTLRQLRFGAQTGWKQRSLELLSLSALPAGVWLVLSLLSRGKEAAGWLAERVFYPLAWLFQQIIAFFDNLLAPHREEAQELLEETGTTEPYTFVSEPYQPGGLPETSGAHIDEKIPYVLIPIGIALLILLTVWLIRRLRENRSEDVLEERTDRTTERDYGEVSVPSEAERRGNRRKIRRIYEKYLKLLQHRRFRREPQDSSEDILEKTRGLFAEEPAQALRELYILARYHPDAPITDAQVREARRLLRRLREEK